MPRNRRSRLWTKLLFSIILFALLDFLAGTVIFRLAPYSVDNGSYRQASKIYSHDLVPNTAAWAGWGRYYYRMYTNSLGFRDSEVRDVPLTTKSWRVVLMGDSFTEGVSCAYEHTFAGILHSRLAPRGIDVLNAGVVSYAPTVYYRKLKYLIEEVKLQVDEVVVFLDISDINDEAWAYSLNEDGNVAYQPEKPGRSWRIPTPMTGREKFKRFLRVHFLSVVVVDRVRNRFAPVQPAVETGAGPLGPWKRVFENERGNWTHDERVFKHFGEEGLERAARSMDRLHDVLRKHGTRLTVVVYPWPNQILARDLDSKQVRFWRDWAAAHGSGFVDLFGDFIDGSDPAVTIPKYYVEGDMHFNPAGHEHAAAAVLAKLPWKAGR